MTRIIVVRARILKKLEGTTPLRTLAPSSRALGADARVTRWLIQQPSADWKTRLQSLRGTEVEETNGTCARLTEADYAEGILSVSERASV